MPRIVIGIFVLAIVAFAGVALIQSALVSAGEDITVTNETFTPTTGSPIVLDDSQRANAYYDRNVTVYDENDTVTDPGSDYRWNDGNGTIEVVAGGALDGDASAFITYEYALTTDEQRRFAGLLSKLPQAIGLALPALLVIILLAFVRGG